MPGELAFLRLLRATLGAPGFLLLVVGLIVVWLLAVRQLLDSSALTARVTGTLLTVALVSVALVGIAELTLFGPLGLGADPRVELDPIAGARGWAGFAWRPVVDNVTLFVPLGAGLGTLLRRGRMRTVLALCVLVSVGVEVFQWAVPSGRIANSADVVANSSGAVLGLLLARMAGPRRGVQPGGGADVGQTGDSTSSKRIPDASRRRR